MKSTGKKNTRIQIAECVELNPGFTAYSCPQSASNVLRNGYYVGGSSQPTAHFKDHCVLSVQNPARNSQGLKPRNTFPYWQGMIGIFKKAGHSLNAWSDVFKMAHRCPNEAGMLNELCHPDHRTIITISSDLLTGLWANSQGHFVPRAFTGVNIWFEHFWWRFQTASKSSFLH